MRQNDGKLFVINEINDVEKFAENILKATEFQLIEQITIIITLSYSSSRVTIQTETKIRKAPEAINSSPSNEFSGLNLKSLSALLLELI